MQARIMRYGATEILRLYGEGQGASIEARFQDLVERTTSQLSDHGMTLDSVVFHRLWLRERDDRLRINDQRKALFKGNRRTSSSNFMSAANFHSDSDVALEVFAFVARDPSTRRLVEFDPPRPYAHYMVQDGWLFLSGMAEEAETLEGQFSRAFGKVQEGLSLEGLDWSRVLEASLFIQKDKESIEWIKGMFLDVVPVVPERIRLEYVDALASVGKHLEIEIVARA